MDNLETLLATTLDKARRNASGAIVERFIKPRASTMFGPLEYLLDGPGPSIVVSVPHEEFFNGEFGIWIGGQNNPYGCCRPIRMHKVWRGLRLR